METAPTDILLLDVNALGYASMYSPLGQLQYQGFPTGGIHGAINSIFARMADRPGAMPVALWDSHAQWRVDLLPEYKGSRFLDPNKAAVRDSYRMQTPIIRMLLSAMGIPQVTCGGSEADDLAGLLCRNLDPSWQIELVTGDTDWWQALAPNINWYSPVNKKLVSLATLTNPENDLKDGHFLSTGEYLQCKALSGDDSDEIPGIDGVGLKTAAKIIRSYGGDIRLLWSGVESGSIKPKGVIAERVASAESRALFERNIRLMDWNLAPAPTMRNMSLTSGRPDWAQIKEVANDFGLAKLAGRSDKAIGPWEKSWGEALPAVDSALHAWICQPHVKQTQLEMA